MEALRDWQTAQFVQRTQKNRTNEPKEWSPSALAIYALSRLPPEQWVAPADLVPLWKRGFPGVEIPDPGEIFQVGFECGCFERISAQGQSLYRLAPIEDAEGTVAPNVFLDVGSKTEVAVDVRRVPFAALELLCRTSTLAIRKDGLIAAPSRIKISHAPPTMWADALFVWLRKRHPAYARAAADVEERRGKTIVHENVLVARVRDLGLKVQIEKADAGEGRVVSLSKEFIAFAREMLPATAS